MNNLKIITLHAAVALVLLCSCRGGKATAVIPDGDTVRLRHAERLQIVKYDGYAVASLADPWNEGRTLHTYVLAERRADGKLPPEAEATAEALRHDGRSGAVSVVGVPLRRAVVATSVHCGLLGELGRQDAVAGVCDLRYVNLPWVRRGHAEGRIADCGNGITPTVEKIIALGADAVLVSPFQNSGGYGRLNECGSPIIELADYMETSALGRAEWMKFYGLLFGAEAAADSMFAAVEAAYDSLAAEARRSAVRKEVLVDHLSGAVWYVPGGRSTLGRLIADAGADYAFAADKSSGSLQLTLESVLAKAGGADVWLVRHNGRQAATRAALLAESEGYGQLKAFRQGAVYGCDTEATRYYEEAPFRPDLLLRDLVIIAHPDLKGLGRTRYFTLMK